MSKIDFNNYKIIPLQLGGALPKLAVWLDNSMYMIKEGKEKNCFHQKSYIAEYIAYLLAAKIGIDCQKVKLVTFNNKPVCACKLFTEDSYTLHSYVDISHSSSHTIGDRFGYELQEVIKVISNYAKFNISSKDHIDRFMLMTCFDALIGNSDRHWGNWGFIVRKREYVSLAPLYDNGNSMSSFLSEDKMRKALTLSEEDFFDKFVRNTPISQVKYKNEKKSFYEIFRLNDFSDYTAAIGKNLKISDIRKIITADESLKIYCSDIELEFFIRYLETRYKAFIGGKLNG